MTKRKRNRSEESIIRKIKKYEDALAAMRLQPTSEPTPQPTPSMEVEEADNDSASFHESQSPDFEVLGTQEECINTELEEEALDEDILRLLGDAPQDQKFGPAIHKELASRWANTIKNGVTKEQRSVLKEKYLPPENCKTIDAPKLNLEAQAAVTDIVVKRDKAIYTKQNQIGCALTALARALGKLLNKNKENLDVINYISDAARLLCDHQYQESSTRRHFILQGLEQTTRDSVKDTEVDQWLFGEGFAEKLRASKAIQKSGQEISVNKTKKPHQQHPSKKPLNFKGPVNNPPRSRAYQAGPMRPYQSYKKPGPRTQPAYRPSQTYSQYKAPLQTTNNRN